MADAKPISVGDPIPEIALPDHTGRVRSLAEFRGHPLVVYFYPKNNTPACTVEACSFRDEFSEFRELSTTVVGISSDSVQSHAEFSKAHRLPFILLSDDRGTARAAFGVPKTFGLFPGRVTYVVDAGGIVSRIINSQLNARRHIADALASLRAASNLPAS